MKTSILISSVAALCLLISFAESTSRQKNDNSNSVSYNNLSYVSINMKSTLPVVKTNAVASNKYEAKHSVAPAENFDYLKFDVNEFVETDVMNAEEIGLLPEKSESELGYLKFDVNAYTSESDVPDEEITDLPESTTNTMDISKPETTENKFSYLKFDVDNFMTSNDLESVLTDELPLKESKSGIQAAAANDFSYLKFDVSAFYNSTCNSGDAEELPESTWNTTSM